MKPALIRFALVFVLGLFLTACNGGIDTSLLKDGDLIFQNKKSKANDFLTFISRSKYNNIGILHSNSGKWYVLEAVQPVQLTPFVSWIKEGENKHYAVKRLEDEDIIITKEAKEKMNKLRKDYMGRAMDTRYEWSDKSLYPSELVWKMYKIGLDVELCDLQTLADFDLTDNDVRVRVKEVYGSKVPLYDDIVSNDAIYNSPLLISIIED